MEDGYEKVGILYT